MGLAFNYGQHMDLTSESMLARARQLVAKNARKYEISQLNSISGRRTQYPRLYFYIDGGEEADQLVSWIETGTGNEPSGEIQRGH